MTAPTGPRPGAVVTFRFAPQRWDVSPDILIASAHQHPRGWTVSVPDGGGTVDCATFEGAVSAVLARTRTAKLLIVWSAAGVAP